MARPLCKRILDSLALHVGMVVVSLLFRLNRLTLRRIREAEHESFYADLEAGGDGCIFAFWHGDSYYMADEMRSVYKYGNFHIMASHSRDGAMMARFLERIGAVIVRGSSSRGGARGLIEMIRMMQPRDFGTLAVDAPRGPRHRVNKLGILVLAQRSGKKIMPLTGWADRKWVVKSWDRTEIPKPFSKRSVVYGEPIEVPPDANEQQLEALRAELERRMLEMKNTYGPGDPEGG